MNPPNLDLVSVSLLTFIVALWGYVRPNTVRDNDNRKLPLNVTRRLFVVSTYVLVYLVIVAGFSLGAEAIKRMPGNWPYAEFIKSLEGQPHVLAILFMAALMSFAAFRDIERTFLIWAHSARHLQGDAAVLAEHLQTCTYLPSEEERRRNVDTLKGFNVFISDTNTQSIDLLAVQVWRKINVLLRLVRDWNGDDKRVLHRSELRLLDEMADAHERKTRLAMGIVRLLDMIAQGQDTTTTLKDVSAMLSGAERGGTAAAAELEARVQGAAEGGSDRPAPAPVRLSPKELQGYLGQIQDYFFVEFQRLLAQLAPLAANSVVLSGDKAPSRLTALKSAGFSGLGRIEPISFDRILSVFLFVGLGGFLILYLLMPLLQKASSGAVAEALQNSAATRGRLIIFAAGALALAFAALFGALIGSSHRHARSEATPWARYVGGALLAAATYWLLEGIAFLVFADNMAALAQSRDDPSPMVLARVAPLATIPFLITLSTCGLARIRSLPGAERRNALLERLIDGLAMALILCIGWITAVALYDLFAIPLPMLFQGVRASLLPYIPVFGLGFLIGALVVREVRVGAHSSILALPGAGAVPSGSAPASTPATG